MISTKQTQYFYSVFSQSSVVLPSIDDLPHVENSIADINISYKDGFESLNNVQPNKASGIDRIGPHILKNCATTLIAPLHYLFSLCKSI